MVDYSISDFKINLKDTILHLLDNGGNYSLQFRLKRIARWRSNHSFDSSTKKNLDKCVEVMCIMSLSRVLSVTCILYFTRRSSCRFIEIWFILLQFRAAIHWQRALVESFIKDLTPRYTRAFISCFINQRRRSHFHCLTWFILTCDLSNPVTNIDSVTNGHSLTKHDYV